MQNESINPALYDEPPGQMSPQEFQRMLYTWFEEKGLVSDLRSHLRVLMIRRLKNMGKQDHPRNFSLSKQAFSLLIAEHLLREGCHYTLSIFSTEVPGVSSQLPFSLMEAHNQDETWRFDQESALNVLELIGISKNSTDSLRILGLYCRNFGSLLSCLVSGKRVESVQTIENKNDESVGGYLSRILSDLGIPANLVEEVNRKVERHIAEEKEESKAVMEREFREAVDEMTKQLLGKDKELKRLLNQQVVLKNEKKKLRNEVKESKKRLSEVIFQEQTISLKESQIKEKLGELSNLERRLKEQLAEDKLKILESCRRTHCTEACGKHKQLNDELKEEVARLENVNKEQTKEIEDLKSKINCLLRDLQSSQVKIEFLNSCLLRSSQINLHPDGDSPDLSEETSESLTGEVLKQARNRLQQLERESDELDLKFKKLKMK